MSLSKKSIAFITGLHKKKYRIQHQMFIAEGIKVVDEFLNSKFKLIELYCVNETAYKNIANVNVISEFELQKISTLKSSNNVLAIFKIPEKNTIKNKGLVIALDAVNDPGNLGTIIRLCDWFGVEQLICSLDTVDCYNSKVVQASMGSLTRVAVHYVNLETYLSQTTLPKFVATMNGINVYSCILPENAVLILGNEANGVSNLIESLASEKITIPRYGIIKKTESLNVATAAAILLNEFRRRI